MSLLNDYDVGQGIVNCIEEALSEEDVVPIDEAFEKVWKDFLATELDECIRKSVRALIEKGELSVKGT